MAWTLNMERDRYDPYIDVWSPDAADRRWYRRLGGDGVYMYRWEDVASGRAGLLGSAADAGAPAHIVSEQVVVAPATSEDVLGHYEALLTLTRDLAGRLVDVANHQQAVQAAARDRADAANEAVAHAVESRDNAAAAGDEANRTRLIRLGVRHMLDAHGTAYQWAHPQTAALGPYHQAVDALSARGRSIADQLYRSLA